MELLYESKGALLSCDWGTGVSERIVQQGGQQLCPEVWFSLQQAMHSHDHPGEAVLVSERVGNPCLETVPVLKLVSRHLDLGIAQIHQRAGQHGDARGQFDRTWDAGGYAL